MKVAIEAWRPSVSGAIGLLVVAAVGSAVREEGTEPHLTSVASISWAGTELVAAWETADDDGVSVHVRRFAKLPPGVTTARGGVVAHYRKYGLAWHTPEVVSDAGGALVVVNPSPGQQLAIPIDRRGAVAGPPQPLTACKSDRSERVCYSLCRRGVAHDGGFVVGHVSGYRVSGLNSVGLSFLDRAGNTLRDIYVSGYDPHSCALARLGDLVVVASGATTVDGEHSVRVQMYELADASPASELSIADGFAAVALASSGDEVALLYGARDGLRVARIGRDGLRATIALPKDIDPETADLGVGARGLFVTWLHGGRVHVQGVGAGREAVARRTSSTAAGTRAAGAGDRCVVAWSTGRGAKLRRNLSTSLRHRSALV